MKLFILRALALWAVLAAAVTETDDATEPALLHHLASFPADSEGCEVIGPDSGLCGLRGCGHRYSGGRHEASVIHHNVYSSMRAGDTRDPLPHLIFLDHVQGRVFVAFHLQDCWTTATTHDQIALAEEALGDTKAQAPARSSYQSNWFIVQLFSSIA